MEWIKVTPETMPPDREPVIITVERGGKRNVLPALAMWRNDAKKWFCLMYHEDTGEEWKIINSLLTVTHWMLWPEPAED